MIADTRGPSQLTADTRQQRERALLLVAHKWFRAFRQPVVIMALSALTVSWSQEKAWMYRRAGCRCTDVQRGRLQIYRCTDVQMCRCTERQAVYVQMYRCTERQAADVQMYRCTDVHCQCWCQVERACSADWQTSRLVEYVMATHRVVTSRPVTNI